MKDNEIFELKKIIQQGIEKSHPVPSPETKERLEKLENSVNKISVDITEIKIHTTYIKEKFNDLPCINQDGRIRKLEDDKNKQIGIIAVLGIIFGAIGWVLTPVINWLLSKIK